MVRAEAATAFIERHIREAEANASCAGSHQAYRTWRLAAKAEGRSMTVCRRPGLACGDRIFREALSSEFVAVSKSIFPPLRTLNFGLTASKPGVLVLTRAGAARSVRSASSPTTTQRHSRAGFPTRPVFFLGARRERHSGLHRHLAHQGYPDFNQVRAAGVRGVSTRRPKVLASSMMPAPRTCPTRKRPVSPSPAISGSSQADGRSQVEFYLPSLILCRASAW